MSLTDIEPALIQAYQGADLGLPTGYENQEFKDKPGQDPWASFHYLPNNPDGGSLGDSGYDDVTGIIQIDINIPENAGRNNLNSYVELLRTRFKKGSIHSYNNQTVSIKSCGRGRGKVVDGFYRVPVTIYWSAQVQR
jgi:hypothetical protein